MVLAPDAWSRWTALLAAACLFLLVHNRQGGPAGTHLEVRSVPSGAEVRLDGRPLGQTNLTLDGLREATVEVEVRLRGYQTARQRIRLQRGQTALAAFTLVALPVEVKLQVEGPRDYQIELGPGPLRREKSPKRLLLEPGLYDLLVSAEGYQPLRRRLEIHPNQPTSLELAPRELPRPKPAATPPPRPATPAPRPVPAYVPAYVPPRYSPPIPRYQPPAPRQVPPVSRPRPVFTPVPPAPAPYLPGQPIMTPL